MYYRELSGNERRALIDAAQLQYAYLDARSRLRRYPGSMRWKRSAGKEYLFHARDRRGYGKSLGPRSAETEKILERFTEGKREAKAREESLRKQLSQHAALCKALKVQRVPTPAAGVLRILDSRGLLGSKLKIAGTYCLFAYEAAAGVFFDSGLMQTEDLDLLWDAGARLALSAHDRALGLLGILQDADPSFQRMEKATFRAVNDKGFMVDLIKPEPTPPWKDEPDRIGGEQDLHAVAIESQKWMAASPSFEQVAIAADGYPVALVAPDPRSFALHKLWLSEQTGREPIKKARDREQALAVASLVAEHLQHLPFTEDQLKMFPKGVISRLSSLPQWQEEKRGHPQPD